MNTSLLRKLRKKASRKIYILIIAAPDSIYSYKVIQPRKSTRFRTERGAIHFCDALRQQYIAERVKHLRTKLALYREFLEIYHLQYQNPFKYLS